MQQITIKSNLLINLKKPNYKRHSYEKINAPQGFISARRSYWSCCWYNFISKFIAVISFTTVASCCVAVKLDEVETYKKYNKKNFNKNISDNVIFRLQTKS